MCAIIIAQGYHEGYLSQSADIFQYEALFCLMPIEYFGGKL